MPGPNNVINLQIGGKSVARTINLAKYPKPRVVLVRPPVFFPLKAIGNEATPSIGLAYISGYLRKFGHEPTLVDAMGSALNRIWKLKRFPGIGCQGLTFDEIIEAMPADAKIIGISAMFSGEWPPVRELIKVIRGHFPQAVLVAGGEHATALSEYCLRDCPELDFIVRGEGEHTFFELCECVGRGISPHEVNGLSYLDEQGKYCQVEGLPRIKNPDVIPWPHWPPGYLEKFWAAGKSFGPQTARDMPMMLSRGCPYRCTFCSNPQMWTTRYGLRDIDDVIQEVQYYIDRYDITAVQLYDLTAITKRSWIIEFLNRLIDENIHIKWSFSSGTRSEVLDQEVLELLKKVGTNYLCYAPESGSPRVLELIKKQIHLTRMNKSIYMAKKLGMVVRVNTIIGFPGERRRDTWKTLFYGLEMAMRGVDDIQPYIFMPYPGSELFQEIHEKGKITLNDRYFFSLIGLNSDLTSFKPLTFNDNMGPKELAIYRLFVTAFAYGISYLFYPGRIFRSIKNICSNDSAATVIEARIKGILTRRNTGERHS